MIKRFFWLSVFLFAVPLFAFIVAEGLIDSVRTEYAVAVAQSSNLSALSIRSGAPCPSVSLNQFLSRPCFTYGQLQFLRSASIALAALAVLMLAAIRGGAAFARGSRDRLILLFVPGVYCVIVLLFCIIVGQAVVLTAATFLLGFSITGDLSFQGMQFVLPAAAGGVAAAYGMVVAVVTALRPEPNSEIAIELTRDEQPQLWRFVDDIATKLGAKIPKQIVCGLEPSFYATAWDLRLRGRGRVLTGETMYVSLPLMRVLDVQEVACVVGHELGHFKGEDTAYSARFVPVFAGTVSAIQSLQGENAQLLGHRHSE